jgi:hypothetical protein
MKRAEAIRREFMESSGGSTPPKRMQKWHPSEEHLPKLSHHPHLLKVESPLSAPGSDDAVHAVGGEAEQQLPVDPIPTADEQNKSTQKSQSEEKEIVKGS